MPTKKLKQAATGHVEKIRSKTHTFKEEFKNQTVIAITAAFAFLIALVWRDYIMSLIKTDKATLFSAITVTLICVIGLVIISKWSSTEEKKN